MRTGQDRVLRKARRRRTRPQEGFGYGQHERRILELKSQNDEAYLHTEL